MKRSPNPCQAWRESICLLAGNSLPAGEQTEIQSHLAECADCRGYHEEMKSLTTPLANWEEHFSRLEPQPALRARWSQAILAAAEPAPHRRFSFRLAFATLWCELIRPSRHAWAAMAALWLVMWGINAALTGARPHALSASSPAPSASFQAFVDQRRVLAELIPPLAGQPIEPPRRAHPQPRSERKARWSIG